MRVLFGAPNLAAGGAERHLSILLPGLRARGFDARLIALDGGGPFERPLRASGVPLEVLRMRHQADLGPLIRSPLLRRLRTPGDRSSGVSGLYIGAALARRREAIHAYNEQPSIGYALSRRGEALVRLIVRQLDLVVAVSEDQSGMWPDRGYPADRIVVVANGVPVHAVAGSKLEIRRGLGIPGSAVVALLVARLRPEKRVPDFARAVVRARETHPELIGLIAGDGPDRPAVEAAAIDRDAVRLLGHRDDIPRLLKAADVFVLTSEYEAVPLAILEAMAAGLPVVATSVGGIPDVTEHGATGLLVAPGHPEAMALRLAELAADRDLRRIMGKTGAKRHRKLWNADTMADGYAQVLQERWATRGSGIRPGSKNGRSPPGLEASPTGSCERGLGCGAEDVHADPS